MISRGWILCWLIRCKPLPCMCIPAFSRWVLQHLLRVEHRLERLLSEDGGKQPLDCRKSYVSRSELALGVQRMVGRKQRHVHPPWNSIIFPCGSRGEGYNVLMAAALGSCPRGGPSIVSLLSLSSLTREMVFGHPDESLCLFGVLLRL